MSVNTRGLTESEQLAVAGIVAFLFWGCEEHRNALFAERMAAQKEKDKASRAQQRRLNALGRELAKFMRGGGK